VNLPESQRLHVSRCESGVSVISFGGILISTMIVGFALIMITIYASFALFIKNLVK